MIKNFHFSNEWKVVSMAPQSWEDQSWGDVHPPINLNLIFSYILAMASRLNTLYGLKTLHVQSSRHVCYEILPVGTLC